MSKTLRLEGNLVLFDEGMHPMSIYIVKPEDMDEPQHKLTPLDELITLQLSNLDYGKGYRFDIGKATITIEVEG